jgi:hypothetical protein
MVLKRGAVNVCDRYGKRRQGLDLIIVSGTPSCQGGAKQPFAIVTAAEFG